MLSRFVPVLSGLGPAALHTSRIAVDPRRSDATAAIRSPVGPYEPVTKRHWRSADELRPHLTGDGQQRAYEVLLGQSEQVLGVTSVLATPVAGQIQLAELVRQTDSKNGLDPTIWASVAGGRSRAWGKASGSNSTSQTVKFRISTTLSRHR